MTPIQIYLKQIQRFVQGLRKQSVASLCHARPSQHQPEFMDRLLSCTIELVAATLLTTTSLRRLTGRIDNCISGFDCTSF